MLIYEQNKILSVMYEMFDGEIEISAISECVYENDLIKEYAFALIDLMIKKILNATKSIWKSMNITIELYLLVW